MKIALVSQEYPPETAKGGIGTQTWLKAQGLSSLGHQVFVISRSPDNVRSEHKDNNITVIRIAGYEELLPDMNEPVQWLTYSLAVSVELNKLNSKVNIDLVDFPEWGAEGYFFFINRNEWNYIPAVVQLHGPLVMLSHTIGWPAKDSVFYKQGTFMEATCVQLADKVYTSSKCSAQWITKYYNPSLINIPVIHLGIELNKFYPSIKKLNHSLTVVFAGKLVPNKGVEELTIACTELVDHFPQLKLRLIGKGDNGYINKLQNFARQTPDLLEFTGFVEKDNLRNYFISADLFAAPSWYEGGPGFVYLEAMACGLPVIACKGSGIEEIIEEGKNGFLVQPRNIEELKSTLYDILSNKNKRDEMGYCAQEYVIEKADTKKCVQLLESFYNSVIKK